MICGSAIGAGSRRRNARSLTREWSRIGNAYAVEDFRLTRQSSGLALVLALIFESIGLRETPLLTVVIDEIHET